MLFQLAVTLWRPLAVPGTPDQRGAFPCSQIPSRSWQCHVWLHHSVSEYKILPVWLHPAWLPGNSLWSVHWELSNPGYPAPAPLNHLGATLCASAAWWKEESKACWPNHMQTTHQRSATRHGGTDSCQSHRQPPEHISASRGQNHHCPGSPQAGLLSTTTSAGVYSPGSTKSAPLKGATGEGGFTLILGGFWCSLGV